MRINKFLAQSELGSRRSVEQLVLSGKVSINGEVVTNLAHQVEAGDVVMVNGKKVTQTENKVYMMLNKPIGYLSSTVDQFGKPNVLKLLPKMQEKVYPIGRLDFNTEGLLLLTNDGDYANRVLHPSNEMEKEYVVTCKPCATNAQLQTLQTPMNINGYTIQPAILTQVKRTANATNMHIIIHEGRNRQIRNMFEQVGLKVVALTRIRIGGLKLNDLPVGQHIILTETEKNKVFK